MNCPNCNTQIDKGQKVCPNCGKEIKHGSKLIAIVVAFIVVVAIVLSIVLLLQNGKKDEITTTSFLSTTTEASNETTTVPEDNTFENDTTQANGIESRYLVDDIGLFTDEEKSELIKRLDTIRENHNFDIVIHTTNTFNGKSAMEYADDYYDYNGYGYGENHDGCILVINMDSRDWWLSTCGYGIEALTDARIENIGNTFAPELTNGNYYTAMTVFLDKVESYL